MKKIYFTLFGIFLFSGVNAQLDTIATFNQVIRDLEVFEGNLFVGGNFTEHEGSTCYWSAYYNGSSISRHTTLIGGNGIREFAVFDNELYNVGSMQFGPSIGVGLWTGSGWDNGGSTSNSHSTIYADDTELYVESDQGLIRSKSAGGTWSTFYDFAGNGGIGAIMRFGNDLIFGGSFSEVDGVPASSIAKWDGSSWSALGAGIDGYVGAMIVYNNELYVSGEFQTAGGVSVNDFAKWDGTSWSDVGGGLTGTGIVHDMVVHDGKLYVSGNFNEIGGSTADHFAYWDGSSWTGINYPHPESALRSIAVYNNEIYLGGWDFDKSRLYRYGGGLSITENTMDTDVSVYPNPSEGVFKIEIDNNQSEVTYRVLNAVGQEIKQGVGYNIDISSHKSGVYFVQVSVQNNTHTLRVVKK